MGAGGSGMIVDLLRHGEPVGGRRYRGQTDDPLSDKGWKQMWTAVAGQQPWQVIVTSTLSRCREFAWALGESAAIPVCDDARFREISFGAWEGLTAAEVCADDPDRLNNYLNDPVNHAPPDAEPLADFYSRVVDGWEALLREHDGKQVLIVAHAGVIRAVTAHILGMPGENLYRLQVANAAISRIRMDAGRHPVLQWCNGHI